MCGLTPVGSLQTSLLLSAGAPFSDIPRGSWGRNCPKSFPNVEKSGSCAGYCPSPRPETCGRLLGPALSRSSLQTGSAASSTQSDKRVCAAPRTL